MIKKLEKNISAKKAILTMFTMTGKYLKMLILLKLLKAFELLNIEEKTE
jgi:hypothetical protein